PSRNKNEGRAHVVPDSAPSRNKNKGRAHVVPDSAPSRNGNGGSAPGVELASVEGLFDTR
ncbi:hypothetical protein, partial [Geomicrobium sp. JCM 19039]|uniref:hypothetical protein n=1 Tax=Geomicrobium sp. JCM 19039 TaxID=1460636 RepID=UPI001EE65A7A